MVFDDGGNGRMWDFRFVLLLSVVLLTAAFANSHSRFAHTCGRYCYAVGACVQSPGHGSSSAEERTACASPRNSHAVQCMKDIHAATATISISSDV